MGKGTVYLDGIKFAQVNYRLHITAADKKEKITGTIEVLGNSQDLNSPHLVFTLVTKEGTIYPFWVIDPHPVNVSPSYRIAIASI
jgi:hypothetical protein